MCNFHNWLIPYINLIGVITFSVTWYLILWVHVYVWYILYVFPYGSLETFNLNKCNVSLDISGDVYQFTKDVAKVDMWLCTSISNWDAIFEYKIFLYWNTSYLINITKFTWYVYTFMNIMILCLCFLSQNQISKDILWTKSDAIKGKVNT